SSDKLLSGFKNSTDTATLFLSSEIKDLDSLVIGYAGIREPVGHEVQPEKVDLIVVPAVVYDKEGHRIGYGKGYYDRFLPKLRYDCLKVGFAYDFQVVEKIPHQPHDFKVDVVITPTKILKTKKEEVK
ncbi:5-formyltetrahydrofolate cyclo-ligase, partial [Sulfurihydrogenibium sp.]|uniref:5-formyltetrahydrofolate cyclo-ligase n=1 Tax=Sulfurihydrogenibium sp. TaxID=2053621 RepID=UPI00262FEC70